MRSDARRGHARRVDERVVGISSRRGSSVGDWVAATSSETGIPQQRWMGAVDALIAELRTMDGEGLHPISPIGIRFQQASPHSLTQQRGRATATFETPIPIGAFRHPGSPDHSAADIREMLSRLENVLVQNYQGRPHLGQRSELSPAAMRAAHGAATFDAFKENRLRFDPYGLFANARTTELGL